MWSLSSFLLSERSTMTLKSWIKSNFKVARRTELASDIARRYLRETSQPLDPVMVTRTICQLADLDLLCGPPNSPLTRTRLVEVEHV